MAKSRLDLQTELEQLLGTRNVYFQPPENLKLKYPCIVYSRSRNLDKKADNLGYIHKHGYTLTLIDSDPDSELAEILEGWKYCQFDRPFVSDNLNHFVFTLFY